MDKIKVALIDDHALLLAGLKMLISAQEDMEVVAEATTGKQALDIVSRLKPACILLDISLPDINGIDLLERLCNVCPSARVLMLTMHEDQQYLERAMELGASGFLLKKAMDQTCFTPFAQSVQEGFTSNLICSSTSWTRRGVRVWRLRTKTRCCGML